MIIHVYNNHNNFIIILHNVYITHGISASINKMLSVKKREKLKELYYIKYSVVLSFYSHYIDK